MARGQGQITVGAVCLHNEEHCLRPEARRHPLAGLSELEPRGGRLELVVWDGQRLREDAAALPGGGALAAASHPFAVL